MVADGYLLYFDAEVEARSWHPALRGQTRRVKLQGQACRTKVSYAGTDAIRPVLWGEEMLAFPAYAGAAFGGLGLSPHTGAYQFQADEVTRKFGAQLLVLRREENDRRSWIVSLRQWSGSSPAEGSP